MLREHFSFYWILIALALLAGPSNPDRTFADDGGTSLEKVQAELIALQKEVKAVRNNFQRKRLIIRDQGGDNAKEKLAEIWKEERLYFLKEGKDLERKFNQSLNAWYKQVLPPAKHSALKPMDLVQVRVLGQKRAHESRVFVERFNDLARKRGKATDATEEELRQHLRSIGQITIEMTGGLPTQETYDLREDLRAAGSLMQLTRAIAICDLVIANNLLNKNDPRQEKLGRVIESLRKSIRKADPTPTDRDALSELEQWFSKRLTLWTHLIDQEAATHQFQYGLIEAYPPLQLRCLSANVTELATERAGTAKKFSWPEESQNAAAREAEIAIAALRENTIRCSIQGIDNFRAIDEELAQTLANLQALRISIDQYAFSGDLLSWKPGTVALNKLQQANQLMTNAGDNEFQKELLALIGKK